jgi:Family of unknown function (DUF6629)
MGLERMCYSASASFSIAATLFPAGIYCARMSRNDRARWLPLALYPIAFSVQQAGEGVTWLALAQNDQILAVRSALGFIFFSHFFWLFWVPFSVFWLEPEILRRRILGWLTGFGFVAGVTVYLPMLISEDWLTVTQVHHSIRYSTTLIYDDVIHRTVLRAIYAAIILASFFLSSHYQVRVFGLLIAVALFFAYFFFHHALISVWCFFAALASLSIVVIFRTSVANSPAGSRL